MTTINQLIQPIARVNDWAVRGGWYLGLTLLAAMTAIVLVGVFFRYVLNNSLPWSEELARFMMVWMTFAMVPIGYRRGLNVAIEMVSNLFKGRWGYLLNIAINIFVLILVLTLIYESFGMIKRGMTTLSSTMGFQKAYVYAIMPVGFFFMFTVGVETILKACRGVIDPTAESDAAATGS